MVRLRVLGESVVEVAGRRVGPEASTLFALLLYLSLERGTRVERRTLTELLWPEAEGEAARHCLRQTLYKLRQLGSRVEAGPSHVVMPAADVTGELLELAAGAPVDLARLRLGGSTFGEFLPGYAPGFSPRYADWLERQRAAVDAVVRRALSAALLDGRARHRWADVESVARHYLRLDPLNEEATLALAEATALTGSKAKALTMLDRYITELGPGAGDIRLPAAVLRRRIAERVPERRYSASSDACFVGRDASMEVLAGLLREARAGRGQACLIWGDAGIGKTRLAAECAKAATLGGAQLLRVGCQASDARRPLSVFVEAVPALLNLRGALGCSPTSMQYLRRLTEHDPSETGPSDAALEADFLFANVRRSMFDLVDAVAAEATLVFLVEDVHWIDRTSWDVLRGMIDWAATRPVLFLFTSRTEHATGEPDPAPALRLVRHHLPAIDAESAGALLDALCEAGERALGDELRTWYVRVAEGNPLFLRELAREWVESGTSANVPTVLCNTFQLRISALPPIALRVLQVVSTMGRIATMSRLEAATECKRFELLDAVSALERAELIEYDAGIILPRHELVSAAAMGSLSTASIKLIHRCVARLLTRELESAPTPSILWDCVTHWLLADDNTHVARLASECASHLLAIGLPVEAASLFERASLLPLRSHDRHEMLIGLANALRLAGLWARAAEVLARVLVSRQQLLPFASSHCPEELEILQAELRISGTTEEMLGRALTCVFDAAAEPVHRAAACSLALRFADHLCDGETARRIFNVSQSLRSRVPAPASDCLLGALVYHSSYGDLEQATKVAHSLVELERNAGTPAALARALRNSWIPLIRIGDFESAAAVCQEAIGISERFQYPGMALCSAIDLAVTHAEVGDIPGADRWCNAARRWSTCVEERYLRESLSATESMILLIGGEEDAARKQFPYGLATILADCEVRRETGSLALWLRLNLFTSRDAVSALQHLRGLYLRTRAIGGQDFNVWCLASTLTLTGERNEAYALVSEYASAFRRELSPLPGYLVAAIANSADSSEKAPPF